VWEDGPLLIAMRRGEMLLIDEISLAEDAVLERLNSVLDPARILVLPEKGREIEEVVAAPGFRLLATMNPGGDFGKKELSPALRNRFTEVWVPAVSAREELLQLVRTRLGPLAVTGEWDAAEAMLDFVDWLAQPESSPAAGGNGAPRVGGSKLSGSGPPSLRDLTAWIDFQRTTAPSLGAHAAFVHGACLVFVDARASGRVRSRCALGATQGMHREAASVAAD
jgi:midasin (ATPase involved in ribosome maturation)